MLLICHCIKSILLSQADTKLVNKKRAIITWNHSSLLISVAVIFVIDEVKKALST